MSEFPSPPPIAGPQQRRGARIVIDSERFVSLFTNVRPDTHLVRFVWGARKTDVLLSNDALGALVDLALSQADVAVHIDLPAGAQEPPRPTEERA
jgi:hypothetical protein